MGSIVWAVFLAVVAITACIFAIRMNVPSKSKPDPDEVEYSWRYRMSVLKQSSYARIGSIVAAILVVFFSVLQGIPMLSYSLDPGESAVVKSFTGEVEAEAVNSENGGIHMKAPWQDATTFNIRNQQVVFQREGGDDLEITASSKDNATVFIDATFTYNLDPGSVVEIYKTYRSEAELRAQMIRDSRGAMQHAPTKFLTMDIRQSRAQLEQTYVEDLREVLEAKYHVTITSVSVRNISFSEEVQRSLDNVQQKNADVETAKASLAVTRINAEATKEEAKAQADADQIIRCGAESIEVKEVNPISGKTETSIQVVPVSIDKCQNRLNEQVLTSKYIDALTKIGEKEGNLIVVPQGFNGMLNVPSAK